MTRTRSRALGLLAALALMAAAPAGISTADSPSITAAKSCSSGYKHAVIGGKHKCLRKGQFCSKSKDKQYHKYGFHCHNGRLKK